MNSGRPSYRISQFPYQTSSAHCTAIQDTLLHYPALDIPLTQEEVGNTYSGVRGGYTYVDAAGELQKVRWMIYWCQETDTIYNTRYCPQVEYVADAGGFRVADSRLPVAPTYTGVAPTFNPKLPVAPQDTPEVNCKECAV